MTNNEIVKASDWCEQLEENILLSDMRANKYTFALQSLQTIKQVLKDYNRQKAEIKRLEEILGGTSKVLTETCAGVRVKAIKEFAEKLKKELRLLFANDEFLCRAEYNVIDSLVKEMVGEG